jgi:excisionase family DNA binding protein
MLLSKHVTNMKITFEQLPEMVAHLITKLDTIEDLLHSLDKPPIPEADKLLTIKQAAEFISLSISTVYGLVHNKIIPVCKRGKRLYFSKQELFDWIKNGRKQTRLEIDREADIHLLNL